MPLIDNVVRARPSPPPSSHHHPLPPQPRPHPPPPAYVSIPDRLPLTAIRAFLVRPAILVPLRTRRAHNGLPSSAPWPRSPRVASSTPHSGQPRARCWRCPTSRGSSTRWPCVCARPCLAREPIQPGVSGEFARAAAGEVRLGLSLRDRGLQRGLAHVGL